MNIKYKYKSVIGIILLFVSAVISQTISGEKKKWHKITITFTGAQNVTETSNPNPFLNYRLDVTFTYGNKTYVVPGYFAADGNAAESSASSGNKWRVHFAPDEIGTWNYSVSFRQGSEVAVNDNANAGQAVDFNGTSGTFDIGPTDKTGKDHRGKGRLQYVGKHHLQFAETGQYFIKGGADAPENLLAYEGFDDTPNNGGRRKNWQPHVQDWNTGDPVWQGDKGKGIIGAINYLSEKGANVFSFLTMNITGDDKNVFPYISDNSSDRTRIDVSKTAQWEILFEHADKIGMYLHFKTQETENDQLLDNGNLGTERKLYYRELIARFGHHLALNWNLGEENTQTNQQVKDMAKFFHDNDPYQHNIVIHTYPGDHDKYNQWTGTQSELTGASIQTRWDNVHSATLKWVTDSRVAGKPWIVANDEQGSANDGVVPDEDDANHDGIRKETLWGNFMAGGAGVEYYFGYQHAHSDLTAQDFRSRDRMWDLTRFAIELFNTEIPFWNMIAQDNLTSDNSDFVLALADTVYLIYDKNGGTINLDFGTFTGNFTGRWYNPRTGEFEGSAVSISASGNTNLGGPPNTTNQDWALLVTRNGYSPLLEKKILAKNYFKISYSGNQLKVSSNNNYDFSAVVYNLTGQIKVRISKPLTENVYLNDGVYLVNIKSKGKLRTRVLFVN